MTPDERAWNVEHAIHHAQRAVAERARSISDPNEFERSLSRHYAEQHEARVREAAGRLMDAGRAP